MVGENGDDRMPELDSRKSSTLIRNGLIGYVKSSNDIDHIALHGDYSAWALGQLKSNGYSSASISNSDDNGLIDRVWHVDVDQMISDYNPSF